MMAKRSPEEKIEGKESHPCLLLHAVDGIVPYLTPTLLKECFPPATVSEKLWIGMAVRDTCVHPVHKDGENSETSTPRGYTFSGSGVHVDRWMEPYTRMTVPTFDLICDAAMVKQGNDSLTTDKKVMLWTPNGRQNITPDLYYHCCRGLKSKFSTSLFDMAPPSDPNNQTSVSIRSARKRQLVATKRTREWWDHFYSMSDKDKIDPRELWVPISLNDADTENTVASEVETILGEERKSTLAGIVLVGWADAMSQKRKKLMEAVKIAARDFPLAVLSTRSLREVLECVSHGVTVIGSDLPRIWAQQKRAFLVNIPSSSDANKRRRTDGSDTIETEHSVLDDDGCLPLQPKDDKDDVTQHPWFRDKDPLVEGCQCKTCQTHSRAYVYHLVCAKELLSEMLLFIHNLHHMMEMIQALSHQSGSEEPEKDKPEFLHTILAQLPVAKVKNTGL